MERINFDPSDIKGMRKLMEAYGDSKDTFYGSNENGERIAISIFSDYIVVVTYQKNNWVRKNIYYPDGYYEEIFEGKY